MGGNDAETRPQRSDTQRVQAQYMRTLISTGQYLTVPAAAAIDDDAVADDGAAVAAPKPMVFHVLEVVSPNK